MVSGWSIKLRQLQDRMTRRLDSDALQLRTSDLVEQAEAALQRAQQASSKLRMLLALQATLRWGPTSPTMPTRS